MVCSSERRNLMEWYVPDLGQLSRGSRQLASEITHARQPEYPFAHFLVIVDRLLYAASAALVLSVVALLAGIAVMNAPGDQAANDVPGAAQQEDVRAIATALVPALKTEEQTSPHRRAEP